ncbi:hypothetical protein PVAND_001683 [Polypedilum vanderplanki]|uniref:Uncharacterized protein n=1 Tax=Polypedilum vanderplanki TaxID=319348 RepID=A0A9J6BNN2_POLVA|nr:hypothetical protein PVAND_001683 [Polypedilum vanderplanki]
MAYACKHQASCNSERKEAQLYWEIVKACRRERRRWSVVAHLIDSEVLWACSEIDVNIAKNSHPLSKPKNAFSWHSTTTIPFICELSQSTLVNHLISVCVCAFVRML